VLAADSTANYMHNSFLNRVNRVPQWQKLHQTHDGLRQWQKVSPLAACRAQHTPSFITIRLSWLTPHRTHRYEEHSILEKRKDAEECYSRVLVLR